MAGEINQEDSSYAHFNDGVNSKNPPLTTQDRHMLEFALRTAHDPVLVTNGQIIRNFGMYPPEFWRRAQSAAWHSETPPEIKEQFEQVMPGVSRPGPIKHGYPIDIYDTKFSQGLEW